MDAPKDEALENADQQAQPPASPNPDELVARAKAEGDAYAYDFAVKKLRAAIHRILDASDDEIRDRAFILSCIRQVGITYQDWEGMTAFTSYINPAPVGLIQIPTEFADYLLLTGTSRPATAIEIGVFRGASAYISDAYFFRLNKRHSYTAVDICDDLADFDYFRNLLPIVKAAPSTSGRYAGQSFDLAFIDGDHSYDGSRVDWLNVGRSSAVVGFHDINGPEYQALNGGVRRTWNEVKLEYRHTCSIFEISHHPAWMGIGVIFNARPPWL